MATSKAKAIGLSSVGGRIRKARTDAFLSIKELSEKIEVSFAYLGMVERGERNASDKILARISDVAGVSFDWLKNGGTPQDSDSVLGKESLLQQSGDVTRIDVSLLLNLILHEAPEISPETLSTVLGVGGEELNGILAEPNNYDPRWYAGCSTLAQRLDIPKFLDKLYEVEFFLKRAEIKKNDYKLIAELCIALSEVFRDKFEFYSQDIDRSMRYANIWSLANEPSEPAREFTFQQGSTRERCRVTLYIPLIERYADRLHGIVDNALNVQDNSIANIALVFSDEDSFEKSKAVIANRIQENPLICQVLKNVAVMLIAPDSFAIDKEKSVLFPIGRAKE